MFNRHQAEITVMQFTGHSLPVHQSMSVPWEFFSSSHFISQFPPTRFPLITAIRMCHLLPVHHLGMAFLAGSKGQNITLWIPSHERAKAGRPARTYIQQLPVDIGCSLEDLPRAMNDREGWRERVREIHAGGVTWWSWLLLWKVDAFVYVVGYFI